MTTFFILLVIIILFRSILFLTIYKEFFSFFWVLFHLNIFSKNIKTKQSLEKKVFIFKLKIRIYPSTIFHIL